MKTCPRCEIELDDSAFSQRSGRQNKYLQSLCDTCQVNYKKQYYQEHKEHMASLVERRWRELKSAVLEKFGSHCAKCGFSDERALQIDHVYNDGYTERKNKSSLHCLRKALNDTEGRYQLLCANCNTIKEMERRKWHMNLAPSYVFGPQEN